MGLPLLQRAIQAANRRTAVAGGVDAVYRRGTSCVSVRVIPRKAEYPEIVSDGFSISQLDQDWSVTAAELVFGGARSVPRRGDRIEVPATGDTYEVLPYSGDECYYPVGMPAVQFHIHSRRIP